MSRRNKIIIVILAIILLAIIAAILYLLFSSRVQVTQPSPDDNVVVPEQPTRIPVQPGGGAGTIPQPGLTIEQPDLDASLKALAKTFAERFGSYSNQGFDNLTDLKSLMSQRMQLTINRYITERAEGNYSGITTKAVSVRINEFDLNFGQAKVTVTTQRSETKGTTNNPRVFYQDLDLSLVQTGDGWKIDDAGWK